MAVLPRLGYEKDAADLLDVANELVGTMP